MKIIVTIGWMIFALLWPNHPAIQKICASELEVIRRAAKRNNCFGDNYAILLAIRLAENGPPGLEFGVMNQPDANDLDSQAGWAAATVVKNRRRWIESGSEGNFIDFLAEKYCPSVCDAEGHINWKKNVKWFYNLLLLKSEAGSVQE